MDNQRCTLKRKRSSTNVNGSSPVPENSLDGQTLPEIDPFIEYGRATQEEDPDADFEESIDKPEEILLFCHNKQQTSSLQTTKPPTPQFLPLPQQAQTIFLPNVLKATAAVPSMEPPPSPLMGETPPATSESSPALPMEEPPPTLSMESPLVEGLEESQRFFSEYEDIEEDSQLEVDESGESDISSDDDEYCDLQILYHGS
ncbi:hypothetical protein V8E54_005024 [Elaphomyces granulatus]